MPLFKRLTTTFHRMQASDVDLSILCGPLDVDDDGGGERIAHTNSAQAATTW